MRYSLYFCRDDQLVAQLAAVHSVHVNSLERLLKLTHLNAIFVNSIPVIRSWTLLLAISDRNRSKGILLKLSMQTCTSFHASIKLCLQSKIENWLELTVKLNSYTESLVVEVVAVAVTVVPTVVEVVASVSDFVSGSGWGLGG